MKFFFHYFMRLIIKGGLKSRATYIFYIFTLWKGLDKAQSLLDHVLSSKLSFRILFSSVSR